MGLNLWDDLSSSGFRKSALLLTFIAVARFNIGRYNRAIAIEVSSSALIGKPLLLRSSHKFSPTLLREQGVYHLKYVIY